jgi:hypothetical protein
MGVFRTDKSIIAQDGAESVEFSDDARVCSVLVGA